MADHMNCWKVLSKLRTFFWTVSRQLDFTTHFKHANATWTPLSETEGTTTATTIEYETFARGGGKPHQIELWAITNVVFPEHLFVVQHIVLEDHTHPSQWRRRNDPVPQDVFQVPNLMEGLQRGDLITFSSNGIDHNPELAWAFTHTPTHLLPVLVLRTCSVLLGGAPVPRRHGLMDV